MLNRKNYDYWQCPEVVDALDHSPYDIGRDHLYTMRELYDAFDPAVPESFEACYDTKVYRHFIAAGLLSDDPVEEWARFCHDETILHCLRNYLKSVPPRKIIGIMGWHQLLRDHPNYRTVVYLAKKLTESGKLIISGGGPGAMEAAHLGAWLAERPDADVDKALQILRHAPSYEDPQWLACAFNVIHEFPRRSELDSLSIPTWTYGHEPPCLFATRIAKLFTNSIREDTLIQLPAGGMIFMPGSAGTLSELFLATERDHYLANEYPSPLIFVGQEFWTKTTPLYPLVRTMLRTRKFKNLLASLVDDAGNILDVLEDFDNIYSLIQARKEGKSTPESILSAGAAAGTGHAPERRN